MKKPMIVTFAMAATMLLALATTGGPAKGTDDREMAYTEVNQPFMTMNGGTQTSLNSGVNEEPETLDTTGSSGTSDVIGSSDLDDETYNDNNGIDSIDDIEESNSMVVSLGNSDSAYLLDSGSDEVYLYNNFLYIICYSDGIATYDAADLDKPANADQMIIITGYNGYDYEIVIPSEIDGIPVKGIANFTCIEYRNRIIHIPISVTKIVGGFYYDTVIYCVEGSAAQVYAEENGYSYVITDTDYYTYEDYQYIICYSEDGIATYSDADPEKPTDAKQIVIITRYTGDKGEVVIPSEIDGIPVTIIGDDSFWIINSVVIPEGVVTIKKGAFFYGQFTSIELPNSLKYIEMGAFDECENLLSELTIPKNVESIGAKALPSVQRINVDPENKFFSSVDGVLFDKEKKTLVRYPTKNSREEYTVPDGTVALDDYAFYTFSGCENLKKVNLPDGLTSLGRGTFKECHNLEEMNIPEGVEKLEDEVFAWCSLNRVVLPNSLKSIGNFAFRCCGNLSDIIFPDNLEMIEGYAFERTGISTVTIPGSVEMIGDGAFMGCDNLTEVVINSGVENIGWGVFGECENLTTVRIPSSVIDMNYYIFDKYFNCFNVTIYCVEGSAAHTYAIAHDIPFVLIEETAITPGDINGDGVVDNKDLLLMRRFLADSVANALSADGFLAADISGDGEVNNQDLIRLRRIIAAN